MNSDIVRLGASSLDSETGAVKWQAVVPVNDNGGDAQVLGEADVIQSLGISARPYHADENGYAEGVILRDCGGRSTVCIGARDTRTAKITGKLEEGDTVVHSTGPQMAAQLQLKEKKRQAVLASKDSKERAMVVVLDGKNDKLQIAACGAIIQIDPKGDVAISNGAGAAILLQGKKIIFVGEVSLPGMTQGHFLMQCASPTSPGGSGALPMTAVKGVGK